MNAALLLTLLISHAEERELAVATVFVGSASSAASLSEIERAVAAAAHLRLGLSPIAEEETFVKGGLEALAACGEDVRCASEELARRGIDLGLVITVNTWTRPPLYGCELIDAKKTRSLGHRVFRSPVETFGLELERELAILLDRAGHPRGAWLTLELAPRSAQVFVDDVELATTGPSRRIAVAPGRHRVRIEAEDHEASVREVDVESGGEVKVAVALRPVPPENTWWWWVAIGAACAAGATAIFVSTRSNDGCFCVGPTAGACPPCP